MLIGDSMDMLESIRTTLDNNTNLSSEVKDNIFELVVLFNSKFPKVDLNNLKNNLEKLNIKKISKFLNNDVSMYDRKNNTLYLNTSRIENGYDGKHILMYEVLNMISSNEQHKGFDIDGRFEALNVGYTEILANYLVGNEGDVMLYPDEAIATNLISIMLGSDVLERAYFNNDTELLINSFAKVGLDNE